MNEIQKIALDTLWTSSFTQSMWLATKLSRLLLNLISY